MFLLLYKLSVCDDVYYLCHQPGFLTQLCSFPTCRMGPPGLSPSHWHRQNRRLAVATSLSIECFPSIQSEQPPSDTACQLSLHRPIH